MRKRQVKSRNISRLKNADMAGKGFFSRHYYLSWRYIRESKNYIFFVLLLLLFGAVIGLMWHPDFLIEYITQTIERILAETQGLGLWALIIYILENNLKSTFFAMIFGVFVGVSSIFSALTNGYFLGFVAGGAVRVEGLGVLWRLVPHGIFEFPAIILALAIGSRLGFFWFSAKNQGKSFLALIVSFLVFIFSYMILVFLFVGVAMVSTTQSLEEIYSSGFSGGPIFLFFLLVVLLVSIFVGTLFLAREDKKLFFKRLEDSLRVFLFVILPLLIIAAIIEGYLIIFLS